MKIINFFKSRLYFIFIVTGIFSILGVALIFVIPNVLENIEMNHIEEEISNLSKDAETTTSLRES